MQLRTQDGKLVETASKESGCVGQRLSAKGQNKVVADDIVVGSGLSALATVLGIVDQGRSVVVFGGHKDGSSFHYSGGSTLCAHLGRGGLGSYWHGVIPLSARGENNFPEFKDFLQRFYQSDSVRERLKTDTLLIPWRPIRPAQRLEELSKNNTRVTLTDEVAREILPGQKGAEVETVSGAKLSAKRVWIAAGALHTPQLLEKALGDMRKPRYVSDHIIGYAGQVTSDEAQAMHNVRQGTDGVLVPSFFNEMGDSLFMLRPARFDFAQLDAGFEKRAVFGLPASKAVAGIAGKFSLGLLAEAVFNKTGFGARAKTYNVYFQTTAKDAYMINPMRGLAPVNKSRIQEACEKARGSHPFRNLRPSQKEDLFLPGIHLHGSLERAEIEALKHIPSIEIVDASARLSIGPEHHSFRVMAAAYSKARKTA